MQTCLIFNPSARGQRAETFRSRLESLIPNCVIWRTGTPGHARVLAAQAVREGFATVIAAGGDGTANEVVNGIAETPTGLESVRLGILPLGTINVFARELGLPLNLRNAARALNNGREMTMDLGRVDFANGGAPRFFLQLAGAGIDSRAVELVSWTLKKKLGPVAYIAAALMALREDQPPITVEGDETVGGRLVLLGNGRFYGGSFETFPGASLRDGLLDVCVLPKVNLQRAAQAGLGLITGKLLRFVSRSHYRWKTFTLRSSSRVSIQLDGDYAGELPATFSVLPKALRVIVP